MLRYLLAWLSCAPILALLLMCASPAQAKRVALVIGNNQYENIPNLQKAVNDARALGRTLKDLDVELITAENLTRRAMNQKLQEFAAKLGRGDEALFFFAGHGVQIDGQNFLLPTDIPNAKQGFRLLFSASPFPSFQRKLTRLREEFGGWWYSDEPEAEGWLCPSLFRYFDEAPAEIYVKAESK